MKKVAKFTSNMERSLYGTISTVYSKTQM